MGKFLLLRTKNFTENSRWMPLPKLYDIFFLGTTGLQGFTGREKVLRLLSEFECPRNILIKQQPQQHYFSKKIEKK